MVGGMLTPFSTADGDQGYRDTNDVWRLTFSTENLTLSSASYPGPGHFSAPQVFPCPDMSIVDPQGDGYPKVDANGRIVPLDLLPKTGMISFSAYLAIHAIMMFLGFGVFLPFGVLVAINKRKSEYSLYIHGISTAIGILCAIGGFIFAVLMNQNFMGSHFRNSHGWIGAIVILFSCGIMLTSFLKPEEEEKYGNTLSRASTRDYKFIEETREEGFVDESVPATENDTENLPDSTTQPRVVDTLAFSAYESGGSLFSSLRPSTYRRTTRGRSNPPTATQTFSRDSTFSDFYEEETSMPRPLPAIPTMTRIPEEDDDGIASGSDREDYFFEDSDGQDDVPLAEQEEAPTTNSEGPPESTLITVASPETVVADQFVSRSASSETALNSFNLQPPTYPRKGIWHLLHKFFGRFVFAFGLLNIFLGLAQRDETRPWIGLYAGWVVLLVAGMFGTHIKVKSLNRWKRYFPTKSTFYLPVQNDETGVSIYVQKGREVVCIGKTNEKSIRQLESTFM